MSIYAGEVVELTATFRDESGTLEDPSNPVDLVILTPSARLSVSPTKIGTGQWRHEYRTTERGLHKYSFQTQDIAIEQDTFLAEERIGPLPTYTATTPGDLDLDLSEPDHSITTILV